MTSSTTKMAADLNDPRIKRLVMTVALPAVAGLTASAAHHAVNAMFIGALGPQALAGVSLVLPLFLLVSAATEGLGIGLATLLARSLGQGDVKAASSVAVTALVAAVPMGIVLSTLIYLALPAFVQAVGGEGDLLASGLIYGRLIAFGVTLGMLQAICDFIAIAEGNSRFSMTVLIASFALNIALDPVFIFLLDFREAGAAIATMVSTVAALLAYAVYFYRRKGNVRIDLSLIRWHLLKPISSIGIPACATSIVTGLGFMVLLRQASQSGGEAGVAAIAIAIRLIAFGQLPVFGFCLGAQSVVSHAVGLGDDQRIKAAIRFMLMITIPVALCYSTLLLVTAGPIARLFTESPEVAEQTAACLRPLFPVFPLAAFQSVLLVLLQSRGRAGLSALVGLAPNGYMLIPLLLLLPAWLGFTGVAIAPAAAAVLTAALGIVVARREWATILPSNLPSSDGPLPGLSALHPETRGLS
ncbi:MATE family efflux transporter [Agrobacterium vitis]|uniref:MATE family efflux transporter n=1 Tax=Rhizobium/Agrobacterium group TaxID=227290 RepID=UPI0008DC1404|nr:MULTISPECIES: MATE family efflux transporter [Rhizobium/Agrobacterium group]MCF1433021.1 MATE family efflux transporter [Allorhizobium ampelinum]MUO89629.1 MATE family efflux transporter [Agrobacterium vitis]MUZ51429.1 MATE family efflux transporter [Agrobacterium vitis]MUZ92421.1 MATE family efflux transporter [Agrobacterium vitis]MVA41217.1 MATE family efflux transporter [Agrobacterium vitis]